MANIPTASQATRLVKSSVGRRLDSRINRLLKVGPTGSAPNLCGLGAHIAAESAKSEDLDFPRAFIAGRRLKGLMAGRFFARAARV